MLACRFAATGVVGLYDRLITARISRGRLAAQNFDGAMLEYNFLMVLENLAPEVWAQYHVELIVTDANDALRTQTILTVPLPALHPEAEGPGMESLPTYLLAAATRDGMEDHFRRVVAGLTSRRPDEVPDGHASLQNLRSEILFALGGMGLLRAAALGLDIVHRDTGERTHLLPARSLEAEAVSGRMQARRAGTYDPEQAVAPHLLALGLECLDTRAAAAAGGEDAAPLADEDADEDEDEDEEEAENRNPAGILETLLESQALSSFLLPPARHGSFRSRSLRAWWPR